MKGIINSSAKVLFSMIAVFWTALIVSACMTLPSISPESTYLKQEIDIGQAMATITNTKVEMSRY